MELNTVLEILYEILKGRITIAIEKIVSHTSIHNIEFKKLSPLEQEKTIGLYLFTIFGTHPEDIELNCPDFLVDNNDAEFLITGIIEDIYIEIMSKIVKKYQLRGDEEFLLRECNKVLFVFADFVKDAILEMQSPAAHPNISITYASAAAAV